MIKKNISYNLFIDSFQSPNNGYKAIFNEYLNNGLPILIAIKDMEVNEANPLSSQVVMSLWREIYKDNPLVEIIIIPNVCSVNYCVGVGYDVKEVKVKSSTSHISAIEIRNQILNGKNDWKQFVDEKIHIYLEKTFRNL